MAITHPREGEVDTSSQPQSQGPRPSYTPTILVTIFFGIFGLIPAFRHSRMARERGYSTSGYWWAFWLPILIPTLFLVSAAGSFVAVTHHEVGNTSAGYNDQPSSVAASKPYVWQPAPVNNMPLEQSTDTPAAVLQYMDGPGGILDMAYATGNETYLLNYYASSTLPAFQADLKAIQGFRHHHSVTISNIQVTSQGYETFTATYEARLGDAQPTQVVATYSWSTRTNASEKTGEWVVTPA